MRTQTAGRAVNVAADATVLVNGDYLIGFLPKTAGTITVRGYDGRGTSQIVLIDAVPVAAGVYTPLPILAQAPNFDVKLAGGASGTLFY